MELDFTGTEAAGWSSHAIFIFTPNHTQYFESNKTISTQKFRHVHSMSGEMAAGKEWKIIDKEKKWEIEHLKK